MTGPSKNSSPFIRTNKELKASSRKKRPAALSQVYGPVPSRRLGYSLGVDILPFKTCSFDCVYCQLGKTPRRVLRRAKFFASQAILAQIKKALTSGRKIDHITFSGSGEPTLNRDIGKLIREIKKITRIPVAVLTNSSMLFRKSVRQALLAADLVVPSLDAAAAAAFRKVNRPDPSLRLGNIIQGLEQFRREFRGQIWLEVMLVKGVNDSPSDIKALKKAVARIRPDKVQLNTVARPPAEKWARPLSREELDDVRDKLGGRAEVVADFKEMSPCPPPENLEDAVLSMVRRRPVNLKDLAQVLGQDKGSILKILKTLAVRGRIKRVPHARTFYYELT
jgi:wyosine [tRNA(Phe)-imidazoG37] synthetase (radical SAM superfamily)